MYEISDALIANWSINNRIRFPIAVDLICPHCARKITFTLQWGGINDTLNYTISRCPACNNNCLFIVIDYREIDSGGDRKGRLFVYPSPKIRYPIPGITTMDEFSDELLLEYTSAINVYNVREWSAAAVICRRLLEGITSSLIPEEKRKGTLYHQLHSLPDYRDLEAPVIKLADAIRKGGNLGAHFDLEKKPNEETVTLMIDLLDYLIEYLFILPGRIENLLKSIDKRSDVDTH